MGPWPGEFFNMHIFKKKRHASNHRFPVICMARLETICLTASVVVFLLLSNITESNHRILIKVSQKHPNHPGLCKPSRTLWPHPRGSSLIRMLSAFSALLSPSRPRRGAPSIGVALFCLPYYRRPVVLFWGRLLRAGSPKHG